MRPKYIYGLAYRGWPWDGSIHELSNAMSRYFGISKHERMYSDEWLTLVWSRTSSSDTNWGVNTSLATPDIRWAAYGASIHDFSNAAESSNAADRHTEIGSKCIYIERGWPWSCYASWWSWKNPPWVQHGTTLSRRGTKSYFLHIMILMHERNLGDDQWENPEIGGDPWALPHQTHNTLFHSDYVKGWVQTRVAQEIESGKVNIKDLIRKVGLQRQQNSVICSSTHHSIAILRLSASYNFKHISDHGTLRSSCPRVLSSRLWTGKGTSRTSQIMALRKQRYWERNTSC